MPITVTAPRGVLTAYGEREILPRLTAALAEASGLTGNSFFASATAAPCTSCRRRTSTRPG